MSLTLKKSTGVGQFGANFREKVVDRCKPNFNTIWEDHGLSYEKKSFRYFLSF